MEPTGRVRRDGSLPFQEIEGKIVIVTPARREVHLLDEVASFLWNELASARTVPELVDAVCETYEVDTERAERDVRAFVDLLAEKQLIGRS